MNNKMQVKHGLNLAAKGEWQQAAAAFRRALEQDPADPETYNYLGDIQLREKLYKEAEDSFRQAIGLNPEYVEAYNNLGVLLLQLNRLEEARECLLAAVRRRSGYAAAYINLGLIYVREQNLEEAENVFRRAIELNPENPEVYNNLGLVFKSKNRFEEAKACFGRAIQLKANYPEVYNNLGLIFKDSGQVEEAGACFCRAIQLRPAYPEAYNNLGVLLMSINNLDKAETCFQRAIQQNPAFFEAEFSLAVLYLLRGEYEKGWEKYDKSRVVINYGADQPQAPAWQGEDLRGRRILLYYEQGFGDTLQFARYAQTVADQAGELVLWVQQPLQRLFISSFPFLKVHRGENMPAESFDFACPLPSLPRIFNTTTAEIPQGIPYIKPSADITLKWHQILSQGDKRKRYRVGAVWAGNPRHHNDRNRSIPFDLFNNLFCLTNVIWVSLQTGSRARELEKSPYTVFSYTEELVDFAETAGLIANLDLVITVDSAVAHLAGAMGKRTWLLLPFAPDWRWQLERSDSPWYPTVQLFRQSKIGDWQEVLGRVKENLKRALDKR
ncbi:Hypothetical protein LUCI_1947 [Lucifera butyrica]|uniref:Uncharacterized protein n=1 Tax=Lucifera butyrica TaxID=1351585 RepID=A0A498R5N7_9FIRM|nr:tetratricopeptide repeat protein [Lucifera butyrica]VBB06711.1 Hypothetical protein LUCI_1947 [Lucifera butyrica]